MQTRRWTEQELEMLRCLYNDYDYDQVAAMLGRSRHSVRNKIKNLGWKKTNRVNSSCFKKGQTPHNKGRKMTEWCSAEGIEKLKQTMFHGGHESVDLRPIGFENTDHYGYVYVRVSDTFGDYRDWKRKQRVVWESHHGPVPVGMGVTFKDGDKSNFDISNLELKSPSEQMAENSYRNNYPEDVAALFQLKGVLSRQINKHKRQQK